jgi:hypothetical protein
MTDPMSAPTSTSSRWPWLLVLLLLAFIAGLIGNAWFERQVRGLLPASLRGDAAAPAATGAANVAALEARVAALEQRPAAALPADVSARIAALEAQGATPVAGETALSPDLSQRLAALEARAGAADSAAQGQAGQVAALQAQISGLGSQLARDVGQARAAVSLVSLRRAIDEGRPYAQSLDMVAPLLLPTDPDLQLLRRHAATGLPGPAQLRQRFAVLRPSLARAAQAPQSASWVDNAMAQVRGLVSVKPADGSLPSSADAALAQAAARVEAGQFAAAIPLLQRLPASARSQAQGWIDQVNAAQLVQASLSRVEAQVLSPRALTTVSVAPAPLPAPVPDSIQR